MHYFKEKCNLFMRDFGFDNKKQIKGEGRKENAQS
jgi:hypothetical protein